MLAFDLKATLKTTAPIVAISTLGRAPTCVDGKLLRAWAKRVEITNVVVVQDPSVETVTEEYLGYCVEGPRNQKITITPGARWLSITGLAADGRVRTSCRLRIIPRTQAVATLAKWTAKERERVQKKVMLGALADKSFNKAIRQIKAGETGDLAASVIDLLVDMQGKKVPMRGIPCTVPGMDGVRCALVSHAADAWSVTAIANGLAAGKGTTAEAALLNAATNTRKAARENAARLQQVIAELAGLQAVVIGSTQVTYRMEAAQ